MPTAVADLTLAQACALLDTGGQLDSQNYIDFGSPFIGSSGTTTQGSSRNQDLTDILWRACQKVCTEAKMFFSDVNLVPLADDQKVYLRDGTKFTVDYTTQSARTYPVRLTQPVAVRVNNLWLRDGNSQIGLWSFDHFTKYWTLWKTAAAGRPVAATVDYAQDCLVFDRPFDAATVTSANMSVKGFGYYGQFDYATDSAKAWAVHNDLQRAVVYRAIVDSQLLFATEISALGLMDRLRAESDEDIERFRNKMTDQLSPLQDTWGMTRPEDRVWL